MKINLLKTLIAGLFFAQVLVSAAQIAKIQVLMINATVSGSGAELKWPSLSFTGSYEIYKKSSLEVKAWGSPIATLPSSATGYTDNSLSEGNSAEYYVLAKNGTTSQPRGYIYVGNKLPEVVQKGGIVLLVDSTFITPLSFEIDRLEKDLKLEGWKVSKTFAGRNQTPKDVKANLMSHIDITGFKVTTLLLLGNIPAPYSGDFSASGARFPPDGHAEGSGNHTGAWPADAYYGDLDGSWTDNTVTKTTGSQTRHHNIPGDGKFDQTILPSDLELEIGRIDLSRMTTFPSSETELMRNYLNRNHLWRTQQTATVERALVDNNFASLNLASTGYHNFSTFFHFDSIKDGDYLTLQNAGSYLWSFGCGAGSYTRANGVATTAQIRDSDIKNIFTILSGSYFGDWDIANNLLRAPLCKTSLASFWGGIPKWYVHTMALGKHIGYGTKTSQNNQNHYFTGAFNWSHYLVTAALMGDPTLMNRHLPQVEWVNAQSINNEVKLNWGKANGTIDGYAIYKVDTLNKTYFRLNPTLVTDTFYTDIQNFVTGNYRYAVKPIRLETTASGSYYNVGGGAFTDLDHTNSIATSKNIDFKVYPNPTQIGQIKIEASGISEVGLFDALGKEVEIRKMGEYYDFSKSPAGIYILRIKYTNGQESSTQLFKE